MEKKQNSKRQQNPKLNAKEKSQARHLLSPIEEAVMYGKPDPFIYNFEGIELYVSRWMGMELLKGVRRKMELVKAAQERDIHLANVPFKYRESLDDPKIILSLTPLLRNRLCKVECYSLYKIILKGRKYFEEELNFNKKYMETLDQLFAKHKCRDLF